MWRSTRLGMVALCLAAAGCLRDARPEREDADLVVIAPHPDDEVLMAGGVMEAAVKQGQRVVVIILTNGDYTCTRDGYVRERETIAALDLVGVDEDDVHFLGYPDGYLSRLGISALEPIERRDAKGQCVMGNTTYGGFGAYKADAHTARTGAAAVYTAPSVADDLAALLAVLKPRDVYLPHPIDEHPDHAMTYAYFRRALDRMTRGPKMVHRAVVHAGPCWPAVDCSKFYLPDEPLAPLPAPLHAYEPDERREVDAEWKLEVISKYPSQTGRTARVNWLASFARTEEAFYEEHLVREPQNQRWVRQPAQGVVPIEIDVSGAETVDLAASQVQSTNDFQLTVTPTAVRLYRLVNGARERIALWPRPFTMTTRLKLRIDRRPDDGDFSEWSLYGPEGFIGQAVIPPPHR